jgi:hypothetical protein
LVNFVLVQEDQTNVPFHEVFARGTQRDKLSLILQVVISLLIFQESVSFVHGNLLSSNLRVVPLPGDITLAYTLPDSSSVELKTRYIVKMDDFSHSTMVADGEVVHSSFLADQTNAIGDDFLRLYDLSVLFHDLKTFGKDFIRSDKKMRFIAHIQKDWLQKKKDKKVAKRIFEGKPNDLIELTKSLFTMYTS